MALLQDIVDDLTVRLGAPTGISDVLFDTIAAGPHPLDVDWMRRESLLGRVAPDTSRRYYADLGVTPTMPGPLRTCDDPERGIVSRWVTPVRWKGYTYGYLWVVNQDDAVDRTTLDSVLNYCDQIGEIFHRRAVTLRDHAESLRQLLTGHRRTRHDTANRFYDVSGYPAGEVNVMVLNVVARSGRQATLPRNVLDGPFPRAVAGDVWRFVDDTRAVLLTPPSAVSSSDTVHRVAEHMREVTSREIRDEVSVVVGIGENVPSLYAAHDSFRQARLAARAAAALETVPDIAAWQDLGAIRAVASIPDDLLLDAIAPGVTRLCDEAPFLAETLEVYFATGGSVTLTGDHLTISRGTVYYRLQRAEKLAGLSLKSGPDRMTLEVGLLLTRLSGRTTQATAQLIDPKGRSSSG